MEHEKSGGEKEIYGTVDAIVLERIYRLLNPQAHLVRHTIRNQAQENLKLLSLNFPQTLSS